ncbi:Aldo/keto reductase, related to diketogulonate reductase [Halapricum desulfuricans]|uniref:Aldo/keto reductase, related to diketogulonate reductase n=1 Tax=Halapricum desulfuricans TaxID=2841257 RepID=A0A897NIN3_9EURY|nr:aldo/keto reductase [Halapricum desulfuricans]QSG10823.1 Aldo/keto reductase, related to diketogulonate reductase [Halapricum desulfuricans]
MDFPQVGLGTMGIDDPAVIETALEVGYRHLDTAQIYENERVVGEGLADSPVPREDVTLATKLWVDSLAPDAVEAGTRASLDRLGVDRVELLYVHRPRGGYDPEGTMAALEAVHDAGLADRLAVSNFTPEQYDRAAEACSVPLVANQVEFHPLFQEPGVLEQARDRGYTVVAYSPLAGGEVFDVPEIRAVAEKHGTSSAAVSIAWVLAHDDVVTIPKASGREHLEANRAARDLSLDPADVERIDGIEREVELFPE